VLARELRLREAHGVNLLASRAAAGIVTPLRQLRFQAGDVWCCRAAPGMRTPSGGSLSAARGPATGLGAPRQDYLAAGPARARHGGGWSGLVPVAPAFFGAAVVAMLLGVLTLREAYEALDLPILVLLACLIPISDAVGRTGGAEVVAGGLAVAAAALPPVGAVALVLVAAMALTPFLNNAATALILAPVAAGLAARVGLNPDPFLMAVAIGAACDFLTPIGHQCNTLVMGPGGYRFGDYCASACRYRSLSLCSRPRDPHILPLSEWRCVCPFGVVLPAGLA